MSFLYPSFLFALASLAVPIIVHLFNFRRYKTVYFTRVSFLKEVKEQTDARSKLKHLLVLLCRLLALAFLVLAFAQPYFPKANAKVVNGKKSVSIYIDNSFSMGALSDNASLLEHAKTKAREIISAYNGDDRFQLLTNDFEGKQQRLYSKDEINEMIDAVEIKPAVRTLSNIIARQKEALRQSADAKVYIYDISDFQKNIVDEQNINADSAISVFWIPLKGSQTKNLYIDTCWLASPVQIVNQTAKLLVHVKNNSSETSGGRLTLKLNGQVKSISNFDLPANGAVIDTLSFTITQTGWNKGELAIIDYPVTFDDTYYFSFNVLKQLNVLIIDQQDENVFLNAAFGNKDYFILKNVPAGQVNYSEFSENQFIILNELQNISTGLSEEIKKYLTNGGNFLIIPAEKSDITSYNSFLASLRVNQYTSWSAALKEVNKINIQQEIFRNVFNDTHENIALPKVTGSFDITHYTSVNEEYLLRFKDGNTFIGKYNFGSGNIYLTTCPVNKTYTDLPFNALFAPMLYQMAISKNLSASLASFIGRTNYLTAENNNINPDNVFHLKGSSQEFIPAQRLKGSSISIDPGNQISNAGFYELGLPSEKPVGVYAFNFDRKESDITYLKQEELKNIAKKLRIEIIVNAQRNLTSLIGELNLGVVLWKVCLILVLIFLAIEILLLRFWK